RRRSTSARRGPRALLLVLGPLAALTVAGCAAGPAAAPTPAAASTPVSGGAVDRSSPGAVALQYSREVFAGQFDQAAQLVRLQDRATLKVLSFSLGPGSVKAENLAVGSTRVDGNTAVAVLTGTLCSNGQNEPAAGAGQSSAAASAAPSQAAASAAAPSDAPSDACDSNTDPGSTDPAFQVALVRTAGGPWSVDYPGLGAAADGSSGAAPSAAVASGAATG
ncbi:hypothetical protein, partial [Kitasatospora sp. LaBMicrA B282]|uniref:hypothetical protein n=1 Tax=Kitasatospora sp. LaBMicrA B282 TaxID=3420949 RepID=UPI003D0E0AB7